MTEFNNSKIIYAVRHCSAAGQESDAELTGEGEFQSQKLAEFFEKYYVERIVSSPFKRAIDSVALIANKHKIPIEVDDRLMERALGTIPTSDWQKHLKQTFDNYDLSFSGGESNNAASLRAKSVIKDILARIANNTLIVSHGNLLTLFLSFFDQSIDFNTWQKLTNPDLQFQLSFITQSLQISCRFPIGQMDISIP